MSYWLVQHPADDGRFLLPSRALALWTSDERAAEPFESRSAAIAAIEVRLEGRGRAAERGVVIA